MKVLMSKEFTFEVNFVCLHSLTHTHTQRYTHTHTHTHTHICTHGKRTDTGTNDIAPYMCHMQAVFVGWQVLANRDPFLWE